jgi:peptidoglycan/LPS O-acetylase OafA/YrhL
MIGNPGRRRQAGAEAAAAYGGTMKFGALEGWRGVCALLVAVLHFRNHVVSHLDTIPLVTNSYLLVDFFFVLSGFVISHAYAERLSNVRDLGWFAVRRFGRLWPLHATVLLVWAALELARLFAGHHSSNLVVHAAFTESRAPAGLTAGLLLLNGLTSWPGALWNVPSWTISVEFWTYLVFALTCLLPARGRHLAAVALCLLGPAILIIAGVRLDTFGYGFFRCIYGFFLGSLTYAAYRRFRGRALRCPTLIEGVILALMVAFLMMVRRDLLPMAAPLLFAGAVYVFAFESGAFSRALRSRPMERLGTWSYSIYLVHFLILVLLVTAIRAAGRALGADNVAAQDPSGAFQRVLLGNAYAMDLIALGYLAVVIWIAAIACRRIEDPGRRYFNALAVRIFRCRAEVASPQ